MYLVPLNCTVKVVKVVDFTLCALGHNKNVLKKNLTWGDLTFSGCKRVIQNSGPLQVSWICKAVLEEGVSFTLGIIFRSRVGFVWFFFFFDLCFRSHLEMLHLLIIIFAAWEGCHEQARWCLRRMEAVLMWGLININRRWVAPAACNVKAASEASRTPGVGVGRVIRQFTEGQEGLILEHKQPPN